MALDDLKLTFRDEFNSLSLDTGTAATDANFWNTSMYNGYVRTLEGNGELQWYVDADYKGAASTPLGVNPFEVNNGVLSIKARLASTQVRNSLWGYAYTSGVLTSAGEFSQQYGYFEVRAQVPEGQGLWPAFWLLSDDGTWPPELDVMEVIGSETNYVHQTTHTGAGVNQGQATWSNEKLSAGFHTYGMDWTASTITYYLDGKATFTMATPSDLHAPMYMLLNLAVGGNWPGDPNDNMDWSTANYNIDYVRVYQHTGVAGSGGLLAVGDGSGAGSGASAGGSTGTGQLIASNGVDVSGATGARYLAADTGANSSRTYTAAEMGLSGVPSSATMTVAYDAQKNMTVTNNGAWNDIKNAAVTSATTSGVTVNNFVAVQVALTGNQNSTVNVTDAKRGNITMGAGNDTITVSAKSDTNDINMMTIAAGDGANQITFNGAANTRTTISAGSGADRITVNGAAGATIQAGGGADIIRSGAGNDIINAGDGDDTLYASLSDGNDTFTGGNGWDILDFTTVPGVVQINQLDGIVTGSAGNDTLLDTFEQISGSNFDDVLSGGHGINCLDGNGGNDVFFGNGGDDLLRGGDGNDTIYCNMLNDGDDRWLGGNGFDTIDYSLLGGAVQVNMAAGTTSGAAGNDQFLDSFEQIIGSNFGDTLIGDGNSNTFRPGNGNDTVSAGDGDDVIFAALSDGNDTYTGGNGWDVLDFSNVGGVIQIDQLNGVVTGSAGNDTMLDVFEEIRGSAHSDVLSGNHDSNKLLGGAGNDLIFGNGGDDWIDGGTGDNTLTGGAGRDVFAFIAGAHATITDFNAAEDKIQLTGGVSAANLTVRTNGGSTLLDLNGNTVMTLAGVTLPGNSIQFI